MINIHVDIDNLWVYEKEYTISLGKPSSYIYEQALSRALEVFERHDIKATFFVVGCDLELESARQFCKAALSKGHKIGNHTYSHRIDFATLSFEEKQQEIQQCHNKIVAVTREHPVGFRAPGYYIDNEIIDILFTLGYAYDSSVLPGFANYLMRAYFHFKGSASQKLFGRKWYIFVSRKPRLIQSVSEKSVIFELPISVVPLLRIPSHPTFIYQFGYRYFNVMKMFYRVSPRNHTYLFHAIDFVKLSKHESVKSPLPPLRWKYDDRSHLIEKILIFLKELSGGPIKTAESQLEHFKETKIPESFFLSRQLKPYTKKHE